MIDPTVCAACQELLRRERAVALTGRLDLRYGLGPRIKVHYIFCLEMDKKSFEAIAG